MDVRFWGVRGSYPVPGSSTTRYGGHTACVEVRPANGTAIVLDAGSGIRKLGKALVDAGLRGDGTRCPGGTCHCHLLISHTHWDHIQGLPFFAPLYVPGNRLTIYAQQRDIKLSRIFATQTQDPYFSRNLADVDADVDYRELVEGTSFELTAGVRVRCARLNHPYEAVGYRVEADGAAVAYVADTSPFDRVLLGHDFLPRPPEIAPPAHEAAVLAAMRAGVVALCRDADLVIYDTMFEPGEYEAVPHWGHSTPEHALEIAEEAGARSLALFHHNPARTDSAQDAIVSRISNRTKLRVFAAQEGQTLSWVYGEGVDTAAKAQTWS